MIILFLLILIWTSTFEASHFNGGTISWAPVYPNSTSSSVLITVTQSYSWVYPTVPCTTNIPIGSSVNLTCVANCSTQDGYANQAIRILTDCIAFSASLNMVSSRRSVNITLNASTYFWISHKGSAWKSLANAATNNTPGWSIVSLIDLRKRSDGLINTPPVVQITSPQFVSVNKTTAIKIPASDVNADDDVRCRWSSQNSSYGVDECDDVCTSGNTSKVASLSNCTLTFTATKSGVWYAMALQVEDFINSTSTTPMSSVAMQFLIYVLPTPNCSQSPIILPLSDCLEVQVNVPVNFTLYAMNYCNRTKTVITDLLPTVSITNMQVSSLVNSTMNTSLVYVTLTWTPQPNQIGLQQFCAVVYTNEMVQSDPYCVTFIVTTSKPCPTSTTSTVTTSLTISTTSTTTTSETTTASTSTITSTTSESTTTSTSPSTITTTTATSTTDTTITTTNSLITTAQTTMTTSSFNQINVPLIVSLSIVGLLLGLCCSCFWLYHLKWSANAQRRRIDTIQKKLWLHNSTLPEPDDLTIVQPNERSQNYIVSDELNDQGIMNNLPSTHPTETLPVSTNDPERTNNLDSGKVKKMTKSHKSINTSVKPHHHRHSHEDISTTENQRCSTTVSLVRKSSKDSEIIKNNDPIKSSTFDQKEPDASSTSPTKIRVIKLPKYKVSSSRNDRNDRIDNVSELNDRRPRSQSDTVNVDNNSVNDISNQRPTTHINQAIVVKTTNSRNKQICQTKCSNTEDENNCVRPEASNFGGITVSKIKTKHDTHKPSINHSKNITSSNNTKTGISNRVIVVSTKQQHPSHI